MAKKTQLAKKKREAIGDPPDVMRDPKLTFSEMSPEEKEAVRHIMFPPEDMPLDLTKAEKIRSTALIMAIQYVEKTICNDAQMYQELRRDGRQLVPATTPHVIRSAVQFEQFLLGRYSSGSMANPVQEERPTQQLESPEPEAPAPPDVTVAPED